MSFETGSILVSEVLELQLGEAEWEMARRTKARSYSPSLMKDKPEKEWLDCLRGTSGGIDIESSPSSLS